MVVDLALPAGGEHAEDVERRVRPDGVLGEQPHPGAPRPQHRATGGFEPAPSEPTAATTCPTRSGPSTSRRVAAVTSRASRSTRPGTCRSRTWSSTESPSRRANDDENRSGAGGVHHLVAVEVREPLLGVLHPPRHRGVDPVAEEVRGVLVVVTGAAVVVPDPLPAPPGQDDEPVVLALPVAVGQLPPLACGGLRVQEGAVPAARAGRAPVQARVEVEHRRRDGVEQDAVVADHHHDTAPLLQPRLEERHGVVVEVRGRLVEQQHRRVPHQQRGQGEPVPLATGQRGERAGAVERRQAEAVDGGVEPRPRPSTPRAARGPRAPRRTPRAGRRRPAGRRSRPRAPRVAPAGRRSPGGPRRAGRPTVRPPAASTCCASEPDVAVDAHDAVLRLHGRRPARAAAWTCPSRSRRPHRAARPRRPLGRSRRAPAVGRTGRRGRRAPPGAGRWWWPRGRVLDMRGAFRRDA